MQKHGPGKIFYKKTGTTFEGQFDKDLKDGVGYEFKSDGRVYCGQFKHDLEEGVGEFLNKKDIDQNFKRINSITL